MTDLTLRLDSNIATQIDVFRKYGEDAVLMKSLLFYFAYKDQNSLFPNYGTIDVAELTKAIGMSRSRLVEPHPDPAHVRDLKQQLNNPTRLQERIEQEKSDVNLKLFDSRLENALYRLNTEAVRFETGFQHYEEQGAQMTVQKAVTIQFLESVEIRKIRSASGQEKYVYDYTLSDKFVKNFCLYFSNINFAHYTILRTKNLEDLYVFLMNLRSILREQNTTTTDTVSFNRLCELANITFNLPTSPSEDPTQYVRNKKRWLVNKFKVLNDITHFGVDLAFKKSRGQTHAYTPVITFSSPELTLVDNQTMREGFLFQTFCKLMLSRLMELYPDVHFTEENAPERLVKYFGYKDRDEQMITDVYLQAHLRVFKSNQDLRTTAFARNLPSKLFGVKTLNEVQRVFVRKR